MVKGYPSDFWLLYDKAITAAENTELWHECQEQVEQIIKEMNLTSEQEETLYNALLQQCTLALYEMYDLLPRD